MISNISGTPEFPTHLTVAHAGSCCQRLLQRLALPQGILFPRRSHPGQAEQELQDPTVPSQCTVHQSTLALLVCKVSLKGERECLRLNDTGKGCAEETLQGTVREQLPLLTSRTKGTSGELQAQ